MSRKHSTNLVEKDPLHIFIQKATRWLQAYFQYILVVLCIAFFAGVGFLAYEYLQKQKNQKAENELYTIKKTLIDLEKKSGGNVFSDADNTFFKKTVKSKYSAEIKNTIQKYQELIKKWQGTSAGILSAIELAHFLYQYEKSTQAVKLLKSTLSSYKKDNLIRLLSSYQLGLYLMDQKDYNLALPYFDFVIQSEKGKWLRPEALLKKALIYEKQNKITEAKNIYRIVQTDYADSQTSQLATQYLNLMTVELKLKKLENQKNEASKSVTKEGK